MRLGDLIEGYASARGGDPDREITDVTPDSRKAGPGSVFVAVPGLSTDGHRFIAEAVRRGAAAVVGQRLDDVPSGVTAVEVPDSRVALGLLAARLHDNPSREMLVVGITGTNGKTTTSYLIESVLREAGWRVGVIGTIQYRWAGERRAALHTTPESSDLQALLREMRRAECDAVVIEVSSHALALGRLVGCDVDLGVFTNLTQDHLDYHGSMEAYFNAKARLFHEHLAEPETKRPRWAVVNVDDPRAAEILARTTCASITYACATEARVSAWETKFDLTGIATEVVTPVGGFDLRSPLIGLYNLSNLLAATAAGVALEIPLETIRRGLSQVSKIPGRMERVGELDAPPVFVDYAHTPDALERLLDTAAGLAPGGLIAVFGCGGDRDRGKRRIMGEIAGRRARLTIVTSDNPRSEDPLVIIDEILPGIEVAGAMRHAPELLHDLPPGPGFTVVPDRREAIALGARLAAPGRVVVIAGKGHEDYQIIGKERHHFDDREEAMKTLGATRTAT